MCCGITVGDNSLGILLNYFINNEIHIGYSSTNNFMDFMDTVLDIIESIDQVLT